MLNYGPINSHALNASAISDATEDVGIQFECVSRTGHFSLCDFDVECVGRSAHLSLNEIDVENVSRSGHLALNEIEFEATGETLLVGGKIVGRCILRPFFAFRVKSTVNAKNTSSGACVLEGMDCSCIAGDPKPQQAEVVFENDSRLGSLGHCSLNFDLMSNGAQLVYAKIPLSLGCFSRTSPGMSGKLVLGLKCVSQTLSVMSGDVEVDFECASRTSSGMSVKANVDIKCESKSVSGMSAGIRLGFQCASKIRPLIFCKAVIQPWWWKCTSKTGIRQGLIQPLSFDATSEVSSVGAPAVMSGEAEIEIDATSSVSYGLFGRGSCTLPKAGAIARTGFVGGASFSLRAAGVAYSEETAPISVDGIATGSCVINNMTATARSWQDGTASGNCVVPFKSAGQIGSLTDNHSTCSVTLPKPQVLSSIAWTNKMSGTAEMRKFACSGVAFADGEDTYVDIAFDLQARSRCVSRSAATVIKYARKPQAVFPTSQKAYGDQVLRYKR